MTVYEMCEKYYPNLWNINRVTALKDAGKITEKEFKKITFTKEA